MFGTAPRCVISLNLADRQYYGASPGKREEGTEGLGHNQDAVGYQHM
jgi:hypothetical protein